MKRILTICKPTFNRKDVLIPDIISYLNIKDERFCVKINDNNSTDGTANELEILAKQDNRLIYNINEKNIGALPNCIKALTGANSEYILFLLDKDTIDLKLLPEFIDYLEVEHPNYGYVNLSNSFQKEIKIYKAGIDAIKHFAYLSKHPSGYFWKTPIWENEIKQEYFKKIDPKFDFPYDTINGRIASKYDGSLVIWPLIINENMRINGALTKTFTYNEDNFFFGKKMRLLAFQNYLTNALDLEVDTKTKELVIQQLTKNVIWGVSVGLRHIFQQKSICYHYNLRQRNIGLLEMISNTIDVKKILYEKTFNKIENRLIHRIYYILIIKIYCKILYIYIKEMFRKPAQKQLTAG